ncbi:helix-turn-helix domain-containing protein [Parahaliea aestuarii]|nr:AraC family transcriptional regulator [Parahaliea aestuarii]
MELTLHILSLIVLCGITAGSLLALQLWLIPWGNRRANRVLSLHLTNYVILAGAYVYYIEQAESAAGFHVVFSLQLLMGPLFYLYTRLLTDPGLGWRKQYLWHFLPAPLMALLWTLQLPLSPDSPLNLACLNPDSCDLVYRSRFIHRLSVYLSMTAYSIASLWILRPYLQRIKESYSAIEEVNLNWLKTLIFIRLLAILLAIGLEIRTLLVPDGWTPGALVSLSPLLLTLLMGWFGLKQRNIQLSEPVVDIGKPIGNMPKNQNAGKAEKKYQTSSLSPEKAKAIWQQLQRTMEQQQPHLDLGLKIADLAHMMNIPSHHLSEVMNGFAQQSFYDFINQYRVDEAARLLKDPAQRHLSVTDIGLQAGFNSNSTYFSHFKKRFQLTPRQYRQQVQA